MAFHEVQFPEDIGFGSVGGPEESVDIIELGSGHEVRNLNWAHPRERWNVAWGVKSQSDLEMLLEFFYARRGPTHGFRFKNIADYRATESEIGTGDGSTDAFQLQKVYAPGTYEYARNVYKPASGTVHVFIDSVEQMSGWTVNTMTGIITFTSPPSSGEIVTATFEFDVPVRFDTRSLPLQLSHYRAGSADVPIVEIKL